MIPLIPGVGVAFNGRRQRLLTIQRADERTMKNLVRGFRKGKNVTVSYTTADGEKRTDTFRIVSSKTKRLKGSGLPLNMTLELEEFPIEQVEP